MWKRIRIADMPFWGKVLFGAGIAALLLLILITLVTGTFFATALAAALLGLYLISAPFVITGAWRAPKPQPTRRPVVRRRRS
ncbi:MAG TPA: hypothetical protein VHR64_14855 [Thermomicrobiales bacterium]|nr:hypothetical protein [Thermomicrobiales bacterium]